MSEHTPGPWATQENTHNDSDRTVYARTPLYGNPFIVARVYGEGVTCKPTEERKANARLIAAAPDLLEALKAVLGDEANTSYPLGIKPWLVVETIVKANRAIAKAEGTPDET